MSFYKNPIEDLKKLIEGKTVLKIEEANVDESLCKFVLTDGTAFRLHATDLGWWIEKTIADKTLNTYKDFNTLFADFYYTDCSYHIYTPDSKIRKIEVYIGKKEVKITIGKDGDDKDIDKFVLDIDSLNDWEKKVVKHKKAKSLIKKCCIYGNMWKSVFTKLPHHTPNCPEELLIERTE